MQAKRLLLPAGWLAVCVLVATGLFATGGRAVSLTRHLASADAAAIDDPGGFDARYAGLAALAYGHLVGAALLMTLGPLQFIPAVRRRWLAFHRYSGRMLAVAGLLAGATGTIIGVWRPFPGPDGGFSEAAAIGLIGPWYLFCLAKAVYHVRRREIARHRVWMIRMFAMALAPPTERLLLMACMAAGYNFAHVFAATFWMAGVVNALAAEVWISASAAPTRRASMSTTAAERAVEPSTV